jgi:tetratricopeptide (TPR) repeat protein
MPRLLPFFFVIFFCHPLIVFSQDRNTPALEPYNLQIEQASSPADLARAYAFRARKLITLHQPDKAVTDYEKSVQTRELGWVLLELGNLYYKVGKYDKALNTATIIVNKYPHLATRGRRLQKQSQRKTDLYSMKAGSHEKTIILGRSPAAEVRRTATHSSTKLTQEQKDGEDGIKAYFEAAADRVLQDLKKEARKKIKRVKWISDNVFRSSELDLCYARWQKTRAEVDRLEKKIHSTEKMHINTFARMNQKKLKLAQKAREQQNKMHDVGGKLCQRYQKKHPEFDIKYSFGYEGCIVRFPPDNTVRTRFPGKIIKRTQHIWIY